MSWDPLKVKRFSFVFVWSVVLFQMAMFLTVLSANYAMYGKDHQEWPVSRVVLFVVTANFLMGLAITCTAMYVCIKYGVRRRMRDFR
jgi:cation transport ATPase